MKNIHVIDLGDISVSFSSSDVSNPSFQKSLCHDKYEIIYVISGAGKYILEGIEFDVIPRSLFISRPFEYRSLILDETAEFTRYVIKFSLSFLSEVMKDIISRFLGEDKSFRHLDVREHSALDSVFDKFAIAEHLPQKEKEAYVSALLTEVIILLSAAAAERLSDSVETLATKVSRYINSNIQRDLSLDTISRRFFVNKYYLCRSFKEQSGISLHSYINRKRVMFAKQLIDSGETASGAAEKVGFGDYSSFYRAYVRIFGVSPTSIQEKENP